MKKILVAEDEEINYLYIEELLSNFDNVTILRAITGTEVVEMVKAQNDIDLVLMDIKMPVMNGYEATKVIKELRPGLPVVAQTAYAMPGDETLSMQAGCDAYISKPIQKERFIYLINTFLHRKQQN
ncbi:MAG: response regulator [Bacteroidales bacterium]|nr:response regulator [Bacteroidales bacterium]